MRISFQPQRLLPASILGGLLLLSFPPQAQERRGSAAAKIEISREARLRVFSKLWETANTKFFDASFNGVDWAAMKNKYRPLVEAAKDKIQLSHVLQQMLDELHVTHMDVNPDVYSSAGLSSVTGPGQNPVLVEGQWVVRSLAEDSPAQQAGVQRGWILTSWNDKPYGPDSKTTCDIDEILKLRFLDLQGQERSANVVCGLFKSTKGDLQLSARQLDDDAFYVRFSNFGEDVAKRLSDLIGKHNAARALVVDLRRNGGGDIAIVQQCLNIVFNEPRVFGEFRDRSGKTIVLKASGHARTIYRGRVFVLIDEASASGSEIFAAAIQESRRGTVVGRVSLGGVLRSREFGLSNGFTADIAVSDYHTSNGVRLEGRGVVPDEPVKITMKDFLENHDADLDRVRELLRVR